MPFDQSTITEVRPPVWDGSTLHIEWSSTSPPGTTFQVYVGRVLAWYGTSRWVAITMPRSRVRIDVGVVGPGEAAQDFSDLLPPSPSDRVELDERWTVSLRNELMHAEVELSSRLTEAQLSMRQLNNLQVGDIIPIEIPETITAAIDDIPVFRGTFGSADGKNAIKVTELVNNQRSRQLMTISGAG